MDNQTLINNISAGISQTQILLDALTAALAIMQSGYKTDQAAIDARIATYQATVQQQIDDLTNQLSTAQGTIATLQTQLTSEQALTLLGQATPPQTP